MSSLLIGFQLLYAYAPPMPQLFQTAALGAASWLVILALGLGKFVAVGIKNLCCGGVCMAGACE